MDQAQTTFLTLTFAEPPLPPLSPDSPSTPQAQQTTSDDQLFSPNTQTTSALGAASSDQTQTSTLEVTETITGSDTIAPTTLTLAPFTGSPLSQYSQAGSTDLSSSIVVGPPVSAASSTGAPNTTSATADTTSSSSSSSKTPIIVGIVVGIISAALVLLLIWLCCQRRPKNKKDKENEQIYGDKPQEQGAETKRDGDRFTRRRGFLRCEKSNSKPRPRKIGIDLPLGIDSPATKALPSPVSPMYPTAEKNQGAQVNESPKGVAPDIELEGSSQDQLAMTTEMSGESVPQQWAELSPNPERSPINTANRASVSAWGVECSGGQSPLPSPNSEGSLMRSNLRLSQSGHSRPGRESNGWHVMSWMDYDAGAVDAGPRHEPPDVSLV